MSKPKFPKLQFNVLSVAEHQYGTCATARCIEQETFVIDLQWLQAWQWTMWNRQFMVCSTSINHLWHHLSRQGRLTQSKILPWAFSYLFINEFLCGIFAECLFHWKKDESEGRKYSIKPPYHTRLQLYFNVTNDPAPQQGVLVCIFFHDSIQQVADNVGRVEQMTTTKFSAIAASKSWYEQGLWATCSGGCSAILEWFKKVPVLSPAFSLLSRINQ